ncbi:MAG: uracil-DNA glycosylase [Candidatus Nanoarchaeia archaeon]
MDKAEALAQVLEKIKTDLACPLKDAATNIVLGKGNPDAPILFIGEAPGEKEDLAGVPFVGRAGVELDKLLSSIGLTLEECYVANILKCRPPKNRDPTVEEIRAHTPYLIEQIQIINPKVICTLGNYSTKFVLAGFDVDGMKNIEGITKLHGVAKEVEVDGSTYTVVPLYHPAAMLYRPQLREVLVSDFIKIKGMLDEARQ